MELLCKARDIEELCSSVSAADQGKRLCYSGISQLVDGQTEIGIQLLEEFVSLMSGTPEKSILRIIAVQILATYYRFKNDRKRMSQLYKKSLEDCKTIGNTELLIIPTIESAGEKLQEKETTQQPLKFEIICLVSEAGKHFQNPDTMGSIIDAAKQIAKDMEKSSVPTSLGLFIFQCNVNMTLQHVLKNVEVSKESITGCHERAFNQQRNVSCRRSHQTVTTSKLFPKRKSISLPRTPLANADVENQNDLMLALQSSQNTSGIISRRRRRTLKRS